MRVVLLAIVLLSGVVRAEAEPGIGVVVMGEPTLQAPLASHIQAWLSERKYPVLDAPFGTEDHKRTFVDCFVIEDLKCATATFAKNARADHLVFARIDLLAGDAREATITGYWFAKHHDAVAEKRACKGCDDAALHATVGSLLEALARASGIGKGRLVLKSNPSGLVAVIDGVKLGVTPIARDLDPGSHKVAIADGARTIASRDVTIARGGLVELTLPERVARARGVGRLAPALLIGGGTAMVAGGAGFLYYGGKDGSDEPYLYPGATRAGAVLAGAGAAAVLGGALWWRAMGKAERPRFVAPALVAAGAAALIGGAIALSYGAKRGPDEPFVYNNATDIGAPLAIAGGGAALAGAMLWVFDDSRRER